MTVLTTARLRLEPITEDHFDAMLALNSQEVVMRYISGQPQDAAETRASIERIRRRWGEWGYGWWAVRRLEDERFIGMACLQHLDWDAKNPHELGWRLDPTAWGQGYATECARRIAHYAFRDIGAPRVMAVAHPDNAASQNVMRRLGMRYLGMRHHYERELAAWELPRADWAASVLQYEQNS